MVLTSGLPFNPMPAQTGHYSHTLYNEPHPVNTRFIFCLHMPSRLLYQFTVRKLHFQLDGVRERERDLMIANAGMSRLFQAYIEAHLLKKAEQAPMHTRNHSEYLRA